MLAHTPASSAMYLSHWGLSHSPFHATAGLGQAYPSQAFEEATARVDYLIAQSRRMGALLGESGLGKSTVLDVLAQALPGQGVRLASVDAMALSPHELLWQVASQLGATPDPADSLSRIWRRLEDTLAHCRWQGQPVVLLVDDADQAGADVARQLIRLAALESAPGARWTILLAADPQRLGDLNASLLERIDMRVDLFPWSEEDTVGYVQHALIDAGRELPIFSDDALTRLHDLALGVPRHIVRLADFALVAGAGAALDAVEVGQIEGAFEALRWSPPTPHLV